MHASFSVFDPEAKFRPAKHHSSDTDIFVITDRFSVSYSGRVMQDITGVLELDFMINCVLCSVLDLRGLILSTVCVTSMIGL